MTKKQIQLLENIIKEHMNVIMQLTAGVGDKKLTPSLVKKLGLPKEISDLITDSYKYGKMSTISGKPLDKLDDKQLKPIMDKLKLTPAQQKSVEYAQMNAQVHLANLQSKIVSTVISTAIQDQSNMYSSIKQVIPDAMANATPRYKVIQQLRETSNDWERDWHRVATTEMFTAKLNGEAQAILDGESPLSSKGGETMVFKRPSPNACKHCKELYLEKGTNKPKVWKLSELISNGTNYGKKQSDWKPTLGVLHPNCTCPLSILPDGYHLDDDGVIQPN